MITFTVYGTPLPKGSTRAFMPKGARFPVVTSSTKGLKDWERKIAAAAQTHATGILLVGPVTVDVKFFLSRPVSMPKRIRHHTKRPDLDKLVRGATDALTGVIWKDDAQAVKIVAQKFYVAHEQEAPRAEFLIEPVEE